MPVAFALHGQISQPAVGVDDAARFYRVLQKGHQACGRGVYNLAHPNPTDPGPIFLSGNDNQGFIQIEPAVQSQKTRAVGFTLMLLELLGVCG